MQSEGIYMVENQTSVAKHGQPAKVHSVEGNAGKVTFDFYHKLQAYHDSSPCVPLTERPFNWHLLDRSLLPLSNHGYLLQIRESTQL
ncbi:unnamed protein product [Lactuca virosa]|uniref:Uncharacterized protein n=1 Tax=Lactuca virosa TaxID=75947 RepID=A0AAU9PB81_9ASTR|nr:unnamed protein product [Lactuca virosa]